LPVNIDGDKGQQVESLGAHLQEIGVLKVQPRPMQVERDDEDRIELELFRVVRAIEDQVFRGVEERVAPLVLHQLGQDHELIVEVQEQAAGRIEGDVPNHAGKQPSLEVLHVRRLEEELQGKEGIISGQLVEHWSRVVTDNGLWIMVSADRSAVNVICYLLSKERFANRRNGNSF